MGQLSRRDFLKLCAATGATLSLSELLKPQIIEAFSGAGKPPVIWIQGGSCSGCSISLLNAVAPEIGEVLTNVISLKFHQTLMAASGDLALQAIYDTQKNYAGQYLLVIEGTVPTGAGGKYATLGERNGSDIMFAEWVKTTAKSAKAVVAIGACATFGGIPASRPNPTGSMTVKEMVGSVPLINIPGCPSHPDWFLGTVVHVLQYGIPKLDRLLRPRMFFESCVHDNCGRREQFDKGIFATNFSQRGCLYQLGCKGPMAFADCPTRQFNNGTNWCVGAGSPCLACVEPGFPDVTSPFFVRMKEYGPAGTVPPEVKPHRLLGGDS